MQTPPIATALRRVLGSLRSRLLPALALMLLAQIALASSARAQGTMGALPDPITSRELDEYARRLGLSAEQRGAIDGLHEAYKAQFGALREGEIEKYLSEGGNAGGMGGRGAGAGMMLGNTDRKAIEESLRQLNSINDKIRSLDNSLFDQVQGLLTEDQTILLTGVRQARERQRYRTGLSRMATFTNPSTQVDLSELVTNLTLSPDEKTNVQPLVAAYESSLTSATRKLHDDANESTVAMMDKLEKLGFTAESVQDNRRRGEMFEAFRTVWGEITTKMNERASDISDLNRKTERSLVSVLSADNSRKLKDSFFRRAYPELRSSTATARAFDVVMKFEDLSDDQRTAISAMYQQYADGMDRLNEEMADAVDAQRKSRNMLDFGGGGGGGGGGRGRDGGRGGNDGAQNDEQMNKLREERQQMTESMRAQMESTLGPEMTEQLQKRVAEARDQQRGEGRGGDRTATFVTVAPMVVSGGPAGAAAAPAIGNMIQGRIENMVFEVEEASRDPFVPAAISGRDTEAYARRLNLDEDSRTILSGLHTEYSDRFTHIEETEIESVREAEDSLWQRGDGGGRPTPPTPEAVDRLYSLRRSAIASIKTLDEQFFNDMQVALLTDEQKPLLERVKQSRLRDIYNRGTSGQAMFNLGGGGGGGGGRGGRGGGAQRVTFGGMGGSSEASVDVSSLVEQSKIAPEAVKPLDGALADYEVTATAAFQNMFESSMRMRQATDRMVGQFMRSEGGGDGGRTAITVNGEGMRQTMGEDSKVAREASTAMTALNRETLERLTAQLQAADADALRRAYNKKAFPDVYRDRRSAEPRLEAALALPDLSDQQRDQLQGMTLEFRNAYDALCDQMIELAKSAPEGGVGGMQVLRGGDSGAVAAEMQAMQERMRNREKLDFERNDLNDRMLARLRATLNEEQVARLGIDNPAGSY